jgi:hypothetical protein
VGGVSCWPVWRYQRTCGGLLRKAFGIVFGHPEAGSNLGTKTNFFRRSQPNAAETHVLLRAGATWMLKLVFPFNLILPGGSIKFFCSSELLRSQLWH